MKLYLDTKNRRFVKSASSNVALTTLVLKRRDKVTIELVYVANSAAITPPTGTTASIGLKSRFSDANFLAFADAGTNTLDLYTEPLEAAFATNPASLPALLEIQWGTSGIALRTATLQVELQNSVILGTEATPAAIPDGKATQAEAEAGTDHATWMTPLRVAQAISHLAEFADTTDELSEGTTNKYFTTARAAAAAPVQSVASKTGAVTLSKSDVGLDKVDNTSDADKPISTLVQTALDAKLQAPFDNEIYIFDSFSETLPARRNTLWTLDFIVSGQSRTLNLPTGPLVRNGDRIGIRFTAPAGTTVKVRLPNPGSPVTIATVTAGESIIYNAVVTSLVGTTPIWQSATDLVGPIRWVIPPATPTSFNDANGAAYSPSDVAFDGSYFYIRGKKQNGDPVWLRTPMSTTW